MFPSTAPSPALSRRLVSLTLLALGLGLAQGGGTPTHGKAASSMRSAVERAVPPTPPSRAGAAEGLVAREDLGAGVARYSFDLAVGDGPHDVVRIHRVVREVAPWIPAPADDAAFLVHGGRHGFEATFLLGGDPASAPSRASLAGRLAEEGVDVWGLDLRWALVPPGVSDPSFMADWTLETDVEDLGRALAVARVVRLLTGSGYGRVHLMGYSRGGQVAYAYADGEAAPGHGERHLEGLVVGDIFLVSDDPGVRAEACARQAATEQQIAAGVPAFDLSFLNLLGELAATAPDDPSPFAPPLTNAQLVLFFGSDAAPVGSIVPFFHQVAGLFVPPFDTELRFTAPETWFEHFRRGVAFQPVQHGLAIDRAICGQDDVPFDDHLDRIRLPVLYLGAGGGVGEFGLHNLALLGSDDVEVALVDLEPTAARAIDFGHADLLFADDAPALVWERVLGWIDAR